MLLLIAPELLPVLVALTFIHAIKLLLLVSEPTSSSRWCAVGCISEKESFSSRTLIECCTYSEDALAREEAPASEFTEKHNGRGRGNERRSGRVGWCRGDLGGRGADSTKRGGV